MEDNKKVDRLSIIKNIVLIAFVVILFKIVYMTTFKYEHYTELAENKTYKELEDASNLIYEISKNIFNNSRIIFS